MAQDARIPYVIAPHGMLDPWSLSQSKWIKRALLLWRVKSNLQHAAGIHYTAVAERDGAASLRLKPVSIVEPNGVELEAYQRLPERGSFRVRFDIAADRPIVLFLSRIHPKKGIDLLIPAFARVAAAYAPETGPVLALVGPEHPGYRATVEALIAQHGVGDRVIWTGMLQGVDKVQAYVDSDIFVLPSYQENFGIVVAEAMAAGLPVIISDKVNLDRDVLTAGAGAVVPTQVEPLATAIRDWLGDPGRRSAAGEAGRRYAFDRFSWDTIANRWAGHYAELIERFRESRARKRGA